MSAGRPLDRRLTEQALALLAELMLLEDAPLCSLVVCGGAALQVMELHSRTTRAVDVLALLDPVDGRLLSPAPLPPSLASAARVVAGELDLAESWLNNGPSSGDGGLFQMGLPAGLAERLTMRSYGPRLKVAFIARFDQIHFKLYAAIDQPGSYHAADLRRLGPSEEELLQATRWVLTHDTSPGFRQLAVQFLRKEGFPDVVERL